VEDCKIINHFKSRWDLENIGKEGSKHYSIESKMDKIKDLLTVTLSTCGQKGVVVG
jgi:hypothetical protein